jgi:hypothetical protein
MILAGFEPANSVIERPQTHALARAVTGIGNAESTVLNFGNNKFHYGIRFEGYFLLFFSVKFSSYELLNKYKSSKHFDCEAKTIKVGYLTAVHRT